MSYEASAHKSQMDLLNQLLHVESASFSILQKAVGLDSDYVTFHLKSLIAAGYVTKNEKQYQLTRAGKEYANRMDTDEKVIERQPKLSVVLIVENDQGQILAQQRLKQPFYGYWGRPTGKIRWGETMEAAAARELAEETGLSATWRIVGLYHKMDYTTGTDEVLEDKFFIIAHGTNPKGTLIETFDGGKNAWLTDQEIITKDKVFQSVTSLTTLARSNQISIIEKRYNYTTDEY